MEQFDWNNAYEAAPRRFHDKLTATLDTLPARPAPYTVVRPRRLARVALVAAAVAVLGCAGVFAAGRVTSLISYSSWLEAEDTLPTAAVLQADYGVQVAPVEEFSNGYRFTTAMPTHAQGNDEEGNTVDRWDEMSLCYEKGESRVWMNLYQPRAEENGQPLPTEEYKGIEISYTASVSKFVPEGYEMTDADKAEERTGKVQFVCDGSDEYREERNVYVAWQQNSTQCSLIAGNTELPEDALIVMAKEMIDKN